MPENPTGPDSASNGHSPTDAPVMTAETMAPPRAEAPEAPPAETAPPPAPAAAPQVDIPPAPWLDSQQAPAKKRGGRRWIAIALIVLFVLGVGGGSGAFLASASLSKTYSPEQAVLNYFAAQKADNIDAMVADAHYLRGDGSFAQFFEKDGLRAMMSIPQNQDISNVQIKSTKQVDSSTSIVTASMNWAGAVHIYDYTVRKNLADTHYLFYNSWTVDIPFTTISFVLPPQPGSIQIDGMGLPSGTATQSVQAIAGYHNVQMSPTPFYDGVTKLANGVDVFPNVTFEGNISAAANSAVIAALKKASTVCDAKQYNTCPGHRYNAPNQAGYVYYLTMPGYPEIDYTWYVFNLTGDFTSGMTLNVPKDDGLMYANGTCTMTMTTNGGRSYRFKGTWSANITYSGGSFNATMYPDCWKSKA